MTVPKWVTAWIVGEGAAADAFVAFLSGIAGKIDAPAELTAAVIAWVQTNTKVTAEQAFAFAALVVTELKSGHPGYNSEAGGVA